jgi:hypothetical protein
MLALKVAADSEGNLAVVWTWLKLVWSSGFRGKACRPDQAQHGDDRKHHAASQ